MYILGLSAYSHGSSAALIKDGEIRFTIEQERLDREKHSPHFPKEAIQECLRFEGITLDEVDKVTFFSKPSLEVMGNLPHFLRYFPKSLHLISSPSGQDSMGFLEKIRLMNQLPRTLKNAFGSRKTPQVEYVEHHLCHASSAFHVSEFKEAAILTLDGRGEAVSTLMAVGRENKITKIREIKVPHSLGHLYAGVTQHLGFKAFFDEWKVMGMAAYGKPDLVDEFGRVIHLLEDGNYRLNLDYFSFHTHGRSQWLSEHFLKTFGPPRSPDAPIEPQHLNLAFALQRTIEKAGVHLAKALHQKTRAPSLCMTGGVALNVLMNKKIMEETPFKNFFIQPVAGDSGTSLGGALYAYYQLSGKTRSHPFQSIYLGPEFSDEEIEAALKEKGLTPHREDFIAKKTAELISKGKIVGWFQGRMEAGPRALGNRSIVANPMDPTMKGRLNARIKKRESFRPFAPSVLEEKVHDFFIMPKKQLSPYMILAGDVRPEKRNVIPAVTHVDSTARVHTVSQSTNLRYWELIREFEKITNVPVLLNTSFNENEPIVCKPGEAIDCFLRNEFDALAIGNFLIQK